MKKLIVAAILAAFILASLSYSQGSGDISVQIVKPYGHVYVFDREIAPIPTHAHRAFNAIVIGWITVVVSTQGNVSKVEFYVDNVLKYNDTSPPFEWTWNERMTHPPKHELKVIGYGNGETASDSVGVLYINPFGHRHHP